MLLGTAVFIIGLLALAVISRGFRIFAAIVFVVGLLFFVGLFGIAWHNETQRQAEIRSDPLARCMESGPDDHDACRNVTAAEKRR